MLRLVCGLRGLLILLVITAPALAQRDRDTYNPSNQAFEVSGQVRISGTSEPVGDVPVRLERFSGGVIDQMNTDNHGRFRFGNLQRGFYKVIINAPTFNPAQQEADLTVLFKAFLVFELISDKSNDSRGRPALTDVVDARVPAAAREEFARGRVALARKSYQDAIDHLQKAIFTYGDFFEAQFLLGTAFMDTRQWEQAENTLLRALEIRPDNAAVLFSLGEVYWRQKRYADAEKTLLDGLKLEDKSWHGYFTLARLYWDMGDVAKAGRTAGRTLQLKPDFAEAHLLAGNILLRLDQKERALIEYQEYLRLEPRGEFASQTQELVQRLTKSIAEKK